MLKGDSLCIRLADKVIRISPKIKYLENYCKDYLCDSEPDFTITLCQEDVEYERQRSVQNALKEEREEDLKSVLVKEKSEKPGLKLNIQK